MFDDFKIRCWGENNYGSLGVYNEGEDIGDEVNEMGDYLVSVNLMTGVTPIALFSGYILFYIFYLGFSYFLFIIVGFILPVQF